MTKKEKARQLLEKINAFEKKKSLTLQDEVSQLTNKLKDNFAVKTLKSVERIGAEVEKFKTDFNLKPLVDAIKQLESEMSISEQSLRDEFETRLLAIPQTPDLTEEVKILQSQFQAKLQGLGVEGIKADIENFRTQLQTYVTSDIDEDKVEQEKLDEALKKLRIELLNRINNIGGGQASPQLLVGGNESKRYRDINLKAGANVTLTIADNNTTKRNEITIAATGGGGGGTVRSINSISINTTAGATAQTDYVYLVSGTTTLTLPDATGGNTNLYTVKNVGTGVVTVNTTSSQTIDGSLTITLSVQYTAVDLISDTNNWGVT